MSKSEKAFRNISEVSDWLETPTHVLRFWESKFSQIKPTKRAGGRRYYRPKDMLLIGGIKQLLHIEGHTIKGAKQVLREKGLNYVVGLSKPIISEEYVEAVNVEKENEEVTKTNVKSHNEKQTSLKIQKNNSSNQKVPDQPGLFDFFDTENPNNDKNLSDKMRNPLLSPSVLLSRIDDLNAEQRKNMIPIMNDLRYLILSWN
tara:strand:- start:13402 stop:14007 length:606 start_codon:yes stop_codon:yes gene_type:complete